MKRDQEGTKIASFLVVSTPFIARWVKGALESYGYQVKEEGAGLDLTFVVVKGEAEVKFFLHNLFLEIATVDRDEEPLRFDERLLDFSYFLSKSAQLIRSKLRILLHLMEGKDIEDAIRRIQADAADYERIRIRRPLGGDEKDEQKGGDAYD